VWDLRRRRHRQVLDLGPINRWCSSCARRTILPRHTDSRRRDFVEGPLGVGLALVSRSGRQRRIQSAEGDRDSGRAGRTRAASTAVEGFQKPFRRSSRTLTCRSTTATCTFRAGAPASCSSTTCRILSAEAHRFGDDRRHCATRTSSAQAGFGAQRRSADGGDQPRRAASLLHQLALFILGRTVLPGRRPRLDGQGRGGGERRHPPGSGFPAGVRRMRPHQVHLDGGDASSDSYCYSG